MDQQPSGSILHLLGQSPQQVHDPIFSSFQDGRVEEEDHSFEQEEDETLRDACERFSGYYLQCTHHGFEEQFSIETFYGGLIQDDKIFIDSLCQGMLMNMIPPQVTKFLKDMALKGYDWGLTRSRKRRIDQGV
ncbi:unnamed protein product [Linum trigynum]|uniref:Retrotransposon gag domain-containing protein n=1 Tax=Linum trigynum TaxID=586398 RepID=A0AAV2FAX3_9ROSI